MKGWTWQENSERNQGKGWTWQETVTGIKGKNGHGKKTVRGIKGKEFVIMCICIGRVQSSPACF